MEQALLVRTDETDGDEAGHEWKLHYIMYENTDDDGVPCFDVFEDDGEGNGTMVCRGYHRTSITHMVLRLGEFVEWRACQPEKEAVAS